MKKSLSYLTEQVKTRLAASMFLFVDKEYKKFKTAYTKYIKFSSVGAIIGTVGCCWSRFYEIFPTPPVVGIISTTCLWVSIMTLFNYIIELKRLNQRNKIFKHIDLNNTNEIIEKFSKLFSEENYNKLHYLTGYSWNCFDISLTDSEVNYLMNMDLKPEQFLLLKETIFKKKELNFTTLQTLEHLSNEKTIAINETFEKFLNDNMHKQSVVAKQHENSKEVELEVAYNRYI